MAAILFEVSRDLRICKILVDRYGAFPSLLKTAHAVLSQIEAEQQQVVKSGSLSSNHCLDSVLPLCTWFGTFSPWRSSVNSKPSTKELNQLIDGIVASIAKQLFRSKGAFVSSGQVLGSVRFLQYHFALCLDKAMATSSSEPFTRSVLQCLKALKTVSLADFQTMFPRVLVMSGGDFLQQSLFQRLLDLYQRVPDIRDPVNTVVRCMQVLVGLASTHIKESQLDEATPDGMADWKQARLIDS